MGRRLAPHLSAPRPNVERKRLSFSPPLLKFATGNRCRPNLRGSCFR
jgi:hypothetical protein